MFKHICITLATSIRIAARVCHVSDTIGIKIRSLEVLLRRSSPICELRHS
jgi:hypothetical protein